MGQIVYFLIQGVQVLSIFGHTTVPIGVGILKVLVNILIFSLI